MRLSRKERQASKYEVRRTGVETKLRGGGESVEMRHNVQKGRSKEEWGSYNEKENTKDDNEKKISDVEQRRKNTGNLGCRKDLTKR